MRRADHGQLLSHIPDLDIWRGLPPALNLDSTNMTPAHWLRSPPVSGTTTAAMTALSSPTARTPWCIRRRP
ncbi:MAG: hypothetical protein ACLTYN_10945 [Dysosmobacter welbionis]